MKTGRIIKVSGPLVVAEGMEEANIYDVVKVGEKKLIGEIIEMRGDKASIQVYEETTGIGTGDPVITTGEPLSLELGPGLIESMFDGIQRPLDAFEKAANSPFLVRGIAVNALNREKVWTFVPTVKEGDEVEAGDVIGTVQETAVVLHKIMVPYGVSGKVKSIKGGDFTVDSTVCVVETAKGDRELSLMQKWPARKGRPYATKLKPDAPMTTGQRVIDTFFPVTKGGAAAVPGPFGAGKTVLQHMEAKNGEADIVIVAACGERAGEVVEILKEFPELEDPKTGRSLMERTIIICNTSSMPVAAREASCYTAVTLAEYYRQMGLDVLLLADSTSRWAQAMREMSGRLEEIPGEEAFPAYLESTIASFYERAGKVRLNNGKVVSVTIGGTVSPAGGNFEEPVTQATLKVVGAFHGLSRERSDARKYPAIHPMDSWSKYTGVVDMGRIEEARAILTRGNEINQMMKVVGEEGTSAEDYIIYQKGELLDAVYLQQNSFDPIDAACPPERQRQEFDKLYEALMASYDLEDKNEIRSFFNQLRQEFLDWHGTVFETPEYHEQAKKIEEFYKSKAVE